MNLLDYITLGVAGYLSLIMAVMMVHAFVLKEKSDLGNVHSWIVFCFPFLALADLIVKATS